MVTEWDEHRSRTKYLSIRDKVLHYPRLLIASSSPLLQENNSPALELFLTSAKDLRDAIVHANPGWTAGTVDAPKIARFMHLDHAYCGRVIDSAVSVVSEIAGKLQQPKSIFWLQNRLPDGTFDESVFE